MDRQIGKTITVYFDGAEGFSSTTATLYDPLGTQVGSAITITEEGEGRGVGTFPAPEDTVEGLYRVEYGTGEITYLTVGKQASGTLYDALLAILPRIGRFHYGRVTSDIHGVITDEDLIGTDGEYVRWWVTPSSTSNNSGLVKAVRRYNGSSLTLTSPFPVTMTEGEPFLLSEKNPRYVRDTIKQIINSYANAGVVLQECTLTLDEDGYATIPEGWDWIYKVVAEKITPVDNQERFFPLGNWYWHLLQGKRLYLKGFDDLWQVHVYGARKARAPQWDDSVLDFPVYAVTPVVTAQMHSTLAGGPAVDPDAHLQREVGAISQGIHGMMSIRSQIPHNLRPVVE